MPDVKSNLFERLRLLYVVQPLDKFDVSYKLTADLTGIFFCFAIRATAAIT